MVINEENLVEEACECQFAVGKDGQPTILCPDEDSKAMAVRAMAETGDVLVKVRPVLIESDTEDGLDQVGDELDQAGDDVEEPEEDLETGFTDDDDDADADDEE